MKHRACSTLFLSLIVMLAGWVGPALEGKPKRIEMAVVAEGAAPLPVSEAADPAARRCSYVAYSGGYIEAGDPTGNGRPATAAQVETALAEALATRGLAPAKPDADPELLLVVHWGVSARDSFEIDSRDRLRKTFTTRLALVATTSLAGEVENYYLWKKSAPGRHKEFKVPLRLDPDHEAAMSRIHDPFYFVVVSAYDHAAARRGEAVPQWRTVLTADHLSGWMSEVAPALIRNGARFLGTNSDKVATVKIEAPAGPAPTSSESPFSNPAATTARLDEKFVRRLLATERVRLDSRAPKP